VVRVYVGVGDDLASMAISTVMVAHIGVLRSGLDHSGSDV